jgi:hypothetical protein
MSSIAGAIAAVISGLHLTITGVTCFSSTSKLGFEYGRLTYHTISAVALMIIFACLVTGKAMAPQDDDAPSKVAHAMYTSSLSILAVLVSITIMNKGDAPCRDPYTVFKFLLLAILTTFTIIAANTA